MEFFIYKDNRQQGPYSLEQLASAGLSQETLVWREGMEQWTPAWRVTELKEILSGKTAGGAVPPPVPPADGQQTGGEDVSDGSVTAATDSGGRRHSRAVIWLAVAAVAFFAMLMTCPDEKKHSEAVSREIMQTLQEEIGKPDTGSATIDMMGGMLGSEIASQIVNFAVYHLMKVDNYILFSVGRVEYEGKSKTVSFGILGHVFTFSADDLRNAVEDRSPLPDTMAL